jgi:endoglucanase
MAGAMTVLSWGGIAYSEGYTKSGMTKYLQEAVKWGTDYLIKAHVAPTTLYGQVRGHKDGFE